MSDLREPLVSEDVESQAGPVYVSATPAAARRKFSPRCKVITLSAAAAITLACVVIGAAGYYAYGVYFPPIDMDKADGGQKFKNGEIEDSYSGKKFKLMTSVDTGETNPTDVHLLGVGPRFKKVVVANLCVYGLGLYVEQEGAKVALKKYKNVSPDELQNTQQFYDDIAAAKIVKTVEIQVSSSLVTSSKMGEAMNESMLPRMKKEMPDGADAQMKEFQKVFEHSALSTKTKAFITCDKKNTMHANVDGHQFEPMLNSEHLCRAFFDMYIDGDAVAPIAKKNFASGLAKLWDDGTKVCTVDADAEQLPESIEQKETETKYASTISSLGSGDDVKMQLLGLGYRDTMDWVFDPEWLKKAGSWADWIKRGMKWVREHTEKIRKKAYALGMYVEKVEGMEVLCDYRGMAPEALSTNQGYFDALISSPKLTKAIVIETAMAIPKDMLNEKLSASLRPNLLKVLEEKDLDTSMADGIMETFSKTLGTDELKVNEEIWLQCNEKAAFDMKVAGENRATIHDSEHLCEAILRTFLGPEPVQQTLKERFGDYTRSLWA